MTLPLPRNAQAIVDARMRGMRPADPVIVSYIGQTPLLNPHVYVDSGHRYDWRFLRGLTAQIFVRAGVDAKHAMAAIFDQVDVMKAYPALIDAERRQAAFIVSARPLKLWTLRSDSKLCKELIPWN